MREKGSFLGNFGYQEQKSEQVPGDYRRREALWTKNGYQTWILLSVDLSDAKSSFLHLKLGLIGYYRCINLSVTVGYKSELAKTRTQPRIQFNQSVNLQNTHARFSRLFQYQEGWRWSHKL